MTHRRPALFADGNHEEVVPNESVVITMSESRSTQKSRLRSILRLGYRRNCDVIGASAL